MSKLPNTDTTHKACNTKKVTILCIRTLLVLKSAQEVRKAHDYHFCYKRERERRYRNLMAFSLMEILIVVAIIAILSSVIVYKSRNIKANQQVQQCRANILQIATALEAYKVSNGFYIPPNSKAGTIGSASNAGSYRIICSNGNGELLDFDEFKFIPLLHCPLGDLHSTSVSNGVTINGAYSYGIRLRNEEYSLRCFKHNMAPCVYVHLKDQPAGWRQYDETNVVFTEANPQTYFGKDTW